MGQEESRDGLRGLARKMAKSGRFCSWRLIQIELRFMQGIREADLCFSDQAIRSELDELCRQARRPAPYMRPAAPEPALAMPALLRRGPGPGLATLRRRTAN